MKRCEPVFYTFSLLVPHHQVERYVVVQVSSLQQQGAPCAVPNGALAARVSLGVAWSSFPAFAVAALFGTRALHQAAFPLISVNLEEKDKRGIVVVVVGAFLRHKPMIKFTHFRSASH